MPLFNAPAYEIERPTGRCALTGQELVPGDPYMATLVELDEQEQSQKTAAAALGFQRIDVAWEPWQQGKRPDRLFGYWKTTVAEPHKKKKLFIDDDILMNLFRRLADDDDPRRIAFRFALGLILMRKRLLRYDGNTRRTAQDEAGQDKQQQWWQLTPKLDLAKGPLGKWNDDEPLEMLDCRLDEQQIQQVTEQLSNILQGEL